MEALYVVGVGVAAPLALAAAAAAAAAVVVAVVPAVAGDAVLVRLQLRGLEQPLARAHGGIIGGRILKK